MDVKELSFFHRLLHKITLRNFSLQKQLIIIFSTLLLIVLVFLIPLIDRNLDNVVDNEIYDDLRREQQRVIFNIDQNSNGYVSEITHEYMYTIKYSIVDGKCVVYATRPGIDMEYIEAIEKVYEDDLATIIDEKMQVIQSKGKYYDDTIFYQIGQVDDRFVVTFVHEAYYSSLVESLKKQVIYVIYMAIFVIAIILYIWLLTLIEPLKIIRDYINDIREGKKQVYLMIDRKDEIGIVSDELIALREELQHQNQMREEMIHNISHDLKTPIALIQTYAQSMKDGIYPYGDKESSLNVIVENADRLEKKVYNLLYLNRLDYLLEQDIHDQIAMKPLIVHLVSQLEVMHPEITIHLELEDAFFRGSEDYWRVCIENIVENAYRYVSSQITITLKEGYLDIYNDGDAIDEEIVDSLFKPYEKGLKGQFGLGLSIVYKIATTYGYQVVAKNKDIGVSFIIYQEQKEKEEE